MRNVTIVESNVEPNKEHLWFYNGKLKWFGPNGWEEIYSQALSPTTTPKPVVSTTSTPRPVYSIKFANITDTYIQILGAGYSGDTISPPMQVNQVYILGYIQDDVVVYSLPNQAILQNLKITAYNDGILVEDSVRYEIEATAFGYWYKFSFKELMEKGVTDVTIEGATSSTATTSTTTSSSTPRPVENGILFINRTNADIMFANIRYGESTVSPPIQPNQSRILGFDNNNLEVAGEYSLVFTTPNQVKFNSLKITAYKYGVNEDVPYTYYGNNGYHYYQFSFKKLIGKEISYIEIVGEAPIHTTTSTTPPYPDTTTTSTRPPNGSGRQITVQPFYGVTGRLSTLMTSKDKLSDIMDMEEKFYPVDTYEYMYYSTSGRYLAVASSNTTENTIVAEIAVAADNLNPHTLYPIETSVNGDTGYKFFLFDLSKSPQLESKYDMYAAYVNLYGYTPTTISTIAPFIDGNIPPFADEK